MCDVKGGCTCGNEYCLDDFDVAALAPKVQVTEIAQDRKVYTNGLAPEDAITYVNEIRAALVK